MKLSFVIPAYNEEEYIGECLEAVIAQKKNLPYDIEVIVVNNNSTDRTEAVARRYPGVRVVEEKEKGLVPARAAGFKASTGDLIANIDADTRIPRGWIRRVMETFEADPKLVALSGPFIYYDAPWEVRAVTHFFYFISWTINTIAPWLFPVVQGGNFVLRRTALDAIGGYRSDLNFWGEDADVARRMNKVGKVKFTFKLPTKSSGRRLAKEGGLTIALRYGINYFWIIFFNRPFTKTSDDVRLDNKGAVIYNPENRVREWTIGTVIILILLAFVALIIYLIRHALGW
jgi:glycosyltransferase involved in cell wall biosynthesis